MRAQVYAVGALGTVGVRGLFRHSCLWGDCCTDFWADAEAPFPKGVRFLSVYSRSDGVVRWQSCLDPHAEHLEIRASHIGMGMHPRAWRAVAGELERLRRSESRRQAALKAQPAPARRPASGPDQTGCVAGFAFAHAAILSEPWMTSPASVTSAGTHVLPVRRLTSLRPEV